MKSHNLKKLNLASFLLLGSFVVPAHANLITNLDFYYGSGSTQLAYSAVDPNPGKDVSKYVTNPPFEKVNRLVFTTNNFPLAPNKSYKLSFGLSTKVSSVNYPKQTISLGSGTTVYVLDQVPSLASGEHVYKLNAATLAPLVDSQDDAISLAITNDDATFSINNFLLMEDALIAAPIPGPSTVDTQQSLSNTSRALQNTFTLQNSVIANSLSYDCNVFGGNNVCISAGGANTQVSAAGGLNNTSALLIAAYRPHPNYRIGAFADQNVSLNNAGSTVGLSNNTPLVGLFGAWNERLDGSASEVRLSASFGQQNATINRQVVGTSEAGSGAPQINSQGMQITAKYGFVVDQDIMVSPYIGMRYTQNNMGGYAEQASGAVTAPLTFSALNTNATTALAGVSASYRLSPQATAFAGAGVETDTNTSNGTYAATGVAGLMPINFNPNPVKTRPTATLAAYYDLEKNQRLGISGVYRQEAFQAVSTTTVMATYTAGF